MNAELLPDVIWEKEAIQRCPHRKTHNRFSSHATKCHHFKVAIGSVSSTMEQMIKINGWLWKWSVDLRGIAVHLDRDPIRLRELALLPERLCTVFLSMSRQRLQHHAPIFGSLLRVAFWWTNCAHHSGSGFLANNLFSDWRWEVEYLWSVSRLKWA